jgi:hypothetical protein
VDLNFDGKRFGSRHANGEGPVAEYRQRGDLLSAEFAGGQVRHGSLAGRVRSDGTLEFGYCMVLGGNDGDDEVVCGRCLSTPEILDDGRILLHEQWERYGPHADLGTSYLEELPRSLDQEIETVKAIPDSQT